MIILFAFATSRRIIFAILFLLATLRMFHLGRVTSSTGTTLTLSPTGTELNLHAASATEYIFFLV